MDGDASEERIPGCPSSRAPWAERVPGAQEVGGLPQPGALPTGGHYAGKQRTVWCRWSWSTRVELFLSLKSLKAVLTEG